MGKELILSIIVSVVLGIAILSTVYALVWIYCSPIKWDIIKV
jgi:hypothetical protein